MTPDTNRRYFDITGSIFLLALLLSLAVTLFSYRSVRNFEELAANARQSLKILEKIEETSASIREQIGAVRGFALSYDPVYLAGFEKANRNVLLAMQELAGPVADNAEHRRALAQLEHLVRKRVALSQFVVWDDAFHLNDYGSLQNKADTAQIDKLISRMHDTESTRLLLRSKAATNGIEISIAGIICGSILSTAILIGVYLRLRREIAKRLAEQNKTRDGALKIEKLNRELKERAGHLRELNKELESFSYSVSHDLRAPLRIISGYALMVEEDHGQNLNDAGRELLQVIRRNVKRMDTLILDLLKLARSTAAAASIDRFSMRELVLQAGAELHESGSRVEFVIGQVDDAPANRNLLHQVWQNLLGNAVKFSQGNARPMVHVSSSKSAAEVIYCVQDNGVGFDMAHAGKLFGAFQRLHPQDDFSGTGVGLALVKRIVTRHRGRAWAESRQQEGARFYFSLPVIAAQKEAA